MLNRLQVHQNSTFVQQGFLIKTSKRLLYPPCGKLCTMLEMLMTILMEVIGSAILSHVLLDSSHVNKTHNKESTLFPFGTDLELLNNIAS
jgi:hypothetical protein